MTQHRSFIEVQFPVSKVSKESYKERKAGQSQTLTGLGKWWGRKPLILVRAVLLGLLMPSGDQPQADREIFLKILSMDDDGLWQRKNKPITKPEIKAQLTPAEIAHYFDGDDFAAGTTNDEKQALQKLVFARLSYDEKLTYCLRPEELDNISESSWQAINAHLGTHAARLAELIQELGVRQFGKIPTVGDCFCGGGSIPFEAARLGCAVYASDLNPLAGLLTWAGLNILSLPDAEIQRLQAFQEQVFDDVLAAVDESGIEMNEKGWRAISFLYCHETICPECKVKLPLSPSWVISDRHNVIGILKYVEKDHAFDIEIKVGVSKEELKNADVGTVQGNDIFCPHCKNKTAIPALRKDRIDDDGNVQYGLRQWNEHEFISRPDDVYKERLYCIKYIEKKQNKSWEEYIKKPQPVTDASYGYIHYVAPDESDLSREEKVLSFLQEHFEEWKKNGYLPDMTILDGNETSRLTRERGWRYWHQLFNPRQLLVQGLIMEKIIQKSGSMNETALALLGLNRCIDFNSKLSHWRTAWAIPANVFYNQALNTLFNYGARGLSLLHNSLNFYIYNKYWDSVSLTEVKDARQISKENDIWITDPPYADAVNYHELSEFFLAWDKAIIKDIFPDWYTDSKRVLAVKGTGEDFTASMVAIYQNLARQMPEDGMQIVMFTHQDPAVWAELTMILWSAGLHVTAAWNIATETESGGLKEGNYVKGTVLLVLRKHTSDRTAYLDEIYPEIEYEVKAQIDSMRAIDDRDDPNFADTDYILAAFAASLKVLTSYKHFGDLDITYELKRARETHTASPIEQLINEAIKIAYDYLIPAGFDAFIWKNLQAEERFYIKGLELEKSGMLQLGAYQEMARGFGVKDYKALLANTKANQVCLKSAKEFGAKQVKAADTFSNSLIRHVLMAIYQSLKAENATAGRNWLRNECYGHNWNLRATILALLDYFARLEHHSGLSRWHQQAEYAKYIHELVEHDGV